MSSSNEYRQLIAKLDAFVRKYYKNLMIRGVIYASALMLAAYLTVALLEYFGRFNTGVRTVLFYSFIATSAYVLVRFFIIPLLKMYRLGDIISHEQAAQIIGTHFTNVQDKLLNTLQLRHVVSPASSDLLEAGINQKLAELRPVPFSAAINLRANRKYLKYLWPPLAVVLILLMAAPNVLTKPTKRLLRHGVALNEDAPFQFHIKSTLTTIENEPFLLEMEIVPLDEPGSEIPDKVYLVIRNQQFVMEKSGKLSYQYVFRNPARDTEFYFYGSGFYSEAYTLKVLPVPQLIDFSVNLSYPPYLKMPDESIRNTGDLTVPAGTKLNWVLNTRNAESLLFRFDSSEQKLESPNGRFSVSHTALASLEYFITTANKYVSRHDSLQFRLQVIPDLAPAIEVNRTSDSTSLKKLLFNGEVRDDYGFRRLTFNYNLQSATNGSDGRLHTIDLPVSKDRNRDDFFYEWNLSDLGINPGDKATYYFEIWDNDGVNGSKATRSSMFEYAAPTEQELEEQTKQQNEEIKDKLEDTVKEAAKLQAELENLKKQLLQKNEMSWQDKKKLEELMKRQQELMKQIQDLQRKNEQKNIQQNEFNQQSENILQKQKQLEDLMDQIMSPEMKRMMEELQRMMEELNKDQIQKELDQMKMNTKDLEKELDRALEQFKQLEWEQKMEKIIDKLNELSKQQDELSKETEKKDSQSQELKDQQDKLNEQFDELSKELKEAQELNKELENPNKTPETGEKEKEIKEEQQKSSDELNKNKKSSASKSQKSAAQKMKEMAEQMSLAMESNESEQQQEDMAALRALLENIIDLSFDQEEVMLNFKNVDIKDPKFNKYGQTQRKLHDDARMVEDSLFALSKRVPQISSIVNHEIGLVNDHMQKALEQIQERKIPEITTNQQYVMTSFNNLALLLDEALKQMQSQSSCNKPGQGSCNKPGGNGKKPAPSAGELKKMQEQLSKQLSECKKQGQNQGQNNSGKEELSKQLAGLAAKQAAIRKLMEDKAAELNQDGSGNGNELKQIARDMEQLHKDIVNDRIDEETLRRQQDILIRLLKAENAERVREQDNQRKSNEARDYPTSRPPQYEEYLKRKERESELLRTVPPGLKPHYRDKANDYFRKLEQTQ